MRRLLWAAGACWLVYGLVTLGQAYGRLCDLFTEDPYGYPAPPPKAKLPRPASRW